MNTFYIKKGNFVLEKGEYDFFWKGSGAPNLSKNVEAKIPDVNVTEMITIRTDLQKKSPGSGLENTKIVTCKLILPYCVWTILLLVCKFKRFGL